jgi:hypothetical protein
MEYYAYCYRDPSRLDICGEPERIYVGKGKGRRVKAHLGRSDKHPFTERLKKMRQNGVEPIIEFLCQGVDDELACLVEMEAINKYGRKDLKLGPLLNLTNGGEGEGGWVLTPARKENMAKAYEASKEKRLNRLAEARAKPQYKANQSKAQTTRWNNEERRLAQKAKQNERWSDAEKREAQSQKLKAYWIRWRAEKNSQQV